MRFKMNGARIFWLLLWMVLSGSSEPVFAQGEGSGLWTEGYENAQKKALDESKPLALVFP
ncbi:MAG: hypothetical protein ABIK28_13590 [Planctomycetota bacterium]